MGWNRKDGRGNKDFKKGDKLGQGRDRNNSGSTDMTCQILCFVRPEFPVSIKLASHLLFWTSRKEFVRDTLKLLEII